MAKPHKVVIVGGGPVGMALALELGLRGIPCALVERRTDEHRIPKGQNLTQRTLEHFYFWGIADELRATRLLPRDYPMSGIVAYGDLMSEYWYAPGQRELVNAYYFQKNDRLPQYQMEKVLRRRLAGIAGVETRFGWTAERIRQDEAGVSVAIRDERGGGTETLEADYLVGCDGARSLVREAAGIARGGADFDQLMVLAVVRSRELHEGLKRFPERSTYNALHPDCKGYWQFFGRIDVGEGFFFHAPVPADTTRDNYDFRARLAKVAGFPFACEFDHVGFWDLRVSVARHYQAGRIFIAGDAAHSHPPYGGYGLNNGIEDAANLGWKLAARIEGWGGDGLIASYSEERRPIFEETGQVFIADRIEADRKFLERYRPERDRAEFERGWKERQADATSWVEDYEPSYEGSPVIAGPPGGTCRASGVHQFAARAGHHLAPQPLSSGRNVFEELGGGFTLLAFGAEDGAAAAFAAGARAANVPLKTVRDSRAGGREAYGAALVLVRPDQYVAWTGAAAPADPARLFARLAGRG